MAADVSSVARMLRGYGKEDEQEKRELVTRNLLGGAAVLGSPEVDLELKVPTGWERRLDLMSGQTYLQKREANSLPGHLHDLNLPPPPPSIAGSNSFSLPDFCSTLDLKLMTAGPAVSAAVPEYSSVCTLEKVKSALERAERESRATVRPPLQLLPRPEGSLPPSSPSTSSTTTSSSIKRRSSALATADRDEDGDGSDSSEGAAMMVVAGCHVCLLYVLVSKVDPRCPKCDAHVPFNSPSSNEKQHYQKKPRVVVDLNFSMKIDEE